MPQGPFIRRRGRAATINFVLYEIDGVDFKVDAAHAAGDTKIMKDEGNEGNTTNGFTDEGTGYSLVLTDTEMQASRIVVYVVDQGTKAWLDTSIVVETFEPPGLLQATDIATLASQTSFTLAEGSADDDAYNGCQIVVTDATTLAQKCVGVISDYTGSTKTVTLVSDPGIFTIAAGDYVDIIAGVTTEDVSRIAVGTRVEMDSNSTQLAAIVGDTNELQTDWTNGGRLDLIIDAILLDTGTTLDGKLNTIDGNVDAILVDTGTTLPATLATIDGNVDAILVDTGTSIPASLTLIDNFLDTEVAAIKAKTDSLTFTVAGSLDCNVQHINDVEITGDGSGTPFGV